MVVSEERDSGLGKCRTSSCGSAPLLNKSPHHLTRTEPWTAVLVCDRLFVMDCFARGRLNDHLDRTQNDVLGSPKTKPNLRNLFMKKLTLRRVAPDISAIVSWSNGNHRRSQPYVQAASRLGIFGASTPTGAGACLCRGASPLPPPYLSCPQNTVLSRLVRATDVAVQNGYPRC
jgi:hypothetical protein